MKPRRPAARRPPRMKPRRPAARRPPRMKPRRPAAPPPVPVPGAAIGHHMGTSGHAGTCGTCNPAAGYGAGYAHAPAPPYPARALRV